MPVRGAPLQRTTLDAFLVRPVGRYFAGPTYAGWAMSPTFSGGAAWGRPSLDDGAAMIRGHDWHGGQGLQPPLDVLLDLSGLEAISAQLFALYVRELVPRIGFFARCIRRQALVVPAGLVGTIIAGFYPMVQGRTPRYRVFRDTPSACTWLGHGEAAAGICALHHEAKRDPSVLTAVRALLIERRCLVSLEAAATALKVSERSLQRALSEANTSFRLEQQQARLHLAFDALAQETKLEAVAEQVGLSNASTFCAWFRESTGMTPTQWRSSARA